jgi:hypothetical protein
MDDTSENPFAGILGSNVLAPPSDIAGALQGLINPGDAGMQQLRGGLAAGLTAAANNWNKPALTTFAGGAGGALQGVNQAAQQQTDNRLKAVQAALQAWQAGDIGALRRAQAAYYRAVAEHAAMTAAPPAQPAPSAAQAVHAAVVNSASTTPSAAPATPAAHAEPERPPGVPAEAVYSPLWRMADGRLFGADGAIISPAPAAAADAEPTSASSA